MCRDAWTDLRLAVGDWRERACVWDWVVVIVGNKLYTVLLHQVILGQGGQKHLLLGCGGGVVVVHAAVVVLSHGLRQVLDLILLMMAGQQWIVRYWCSGQLADVNTSLTGLQ